MVDEMKYVIKNSILRIYNAVGGEAVLGTPTDDESKMLLLGHETWAQPFTKGIVVWDHTSAKGAAYTNEQRIKINSDRNFRRVVGVKGVYRTGDLDGIDALSMRTVIELGITRSITFNSGRDTTIPGVKNYYYEIKTGSSKDDTYRDFVRETADRVQFGKALNRVAENAGSVSLVHCTAGKDRTGWAMFLLQRINGMNLADALADYMRTKTYSGGSVDVDWIAAARDEVSKRYKTYDAYLLAAGVTPANLAKLKVMH